MQRLAVFVAGILALGVAVWFLGWMVVTINAVPLWIIIGLVLALMGFDFYESLRNETSENGNGSSSSA